MLQKRTTLSEMSKVLNVSVSTVSKALLNSTEISAQTKKRVNDFAKKCNYKRNHMAANLRSGQTKTIGLIIPNITNLFYAKAFVAVEKHLSQRGYKLITSISNESRLKESKCLNEMAYGYIDGLIICVAKETELKKQYDHIEQLINQGVPVVMFDRTCETINCDQVILDNYQIAYDATEHLINNKNCKNILITSLVDDFQNVRQRRKGAINAIKNQNNTIKSSVINPATSENLKHQLQVALKEDKTIDAIFCTNEQTVTQAIYATRNLTEKASESEIIIAGFCSELHKNYSSSLIIVDHNAEQIGTQTAKLILKRLEKTEKPKLKEIELQLN